MEYLAVDFGTANSLAAELGFDSILRFVNLEDDSPLLPTAIFFPRLGLQSHDPSNIDLATRFEEEQRREKERNERARSEIETRYRGFILNNAPTKPKPPERGDYLTERAFITAQETHKTALRHYKNALNQFINTDGAEHLDKLNASLGTALSDDQIRKKSEINLRKELAQKNFEENFSQTFFSVIKEEGHPDPIFGQKAIDAYASLNLGGFLLKSPKAFLGATLHPELRDLFIISISKILRYIKEKAESKFSKEYFGIVIGRPVNFLGNLDGHGNDSALSIMRAAAKGAGFGEVRFVLEPHAAGLAIANAIAESDDPALIIDLGGGTTDCTYLEPLKTDRRSLLVISSSGERVGGADFDESLAWHLFSEHLGRGVTLKDGKPMPTSLISDLLATRDVHKQAAFRKSYDEIERFLSLSNEDERVERLLETLKFQAQHKLISTAEQIKKELSNVEKIDVDIDFFSSPFEIACDRRRYLEYVAREITRVTRVVRSCVEQSKHTARPVRAYLTGGMALSPSILSALQLALPGGSSFSGIDPFRSVCAGLALVARTLSDSESVAQEPTKVRGVPIYK